MNRRHHPLDPEERALARHLADAGGDGPSPELDARILAAARAAQVGGAAPMPAHTGQRRPRRRWPMALGLAASVTLAIGVAWQMREPPRPAFAPAGGLETAPDPVAAPPPPAAEPGRDSAPPAAQAQAVADRAGASPPAPDGAAAARHPEQPHQAGTQAKADADQDRARQAAIAAASRRSSERAEQAARQASAAMAATAASEAQPADAYREPLPAPPPPAAPAAPSVRITATVDGSTVDIDSRRLSELEAASRAEAPAAFADMAGLPPGAEAAALEDDARLPAAQWLQRIGERRQRGETELARASLARFVHAHPEVPVPAELRPLLP